LLALAAGKRPKTGGRRKGTPNQSTRALRDALLEVYARLQSEAGGDNSHFLDWARDNPTEYYKLALRILPRAAVIPEAADPITVIRRIIVAPASRDAAGQS
jgi:hypothetical protein